LGLLGLALKKRRQIELQYALDRCVGQTALQLQRWMQELENLNLALLVARAGASVPIPPVAAASRVAVFASAGTQQWILLRWTTKQVQWLARGGCGDADWALPTPLPSHGLYRPPPDGLGPRPLQLRKSQTPTRISPSDREEISLGKVRLTKLPKISTAEIWIRPQERNTLLEAVLPSHWKTRWTGPN
jgi:hypothetical protein